MSPLVLGGVDPVAAASLPDGADAATAASLYPKLDTTKHVVMEVNEPDYGALLAESMRADEASMRVQTAFNVSDTRTKAGDAAPGASTPLAVNATPSASYGQALGVVPGTGKPSHVDTLNFSYADPGVPLHGAHRSEGSRKLLQTTTTVDLLVVYTQAAASTVGGVAAIESTIRIAVAYTNTTYRNSMVSQALRVVGIRMVRGMYLGGGNYCLVLAQLLTPAGRGAVLQVVWPETQSVHPISEMPNVATWRDEVRCCENQGWQACAHCTCH